MKNMLYLFLNLYGTKDKIDIITNILQYWKTKLIAR